MSTPLHLIPDAPIASPGFDRLDRMAFVRSFAEAIRAVKGTDSVVLALAGPWGSGKSSLLNLVAGELREKTDAIDPLVMRFNPWWFSGTEQLVPAFLQQLGAALSRPEVVEALGPATAALDHLAAAIATPGSMGLSENPAERDIEEIRNRIVRVLEKSDRRILIFMDDIDRLSPQEMTQLLLIVRAVADFPNTTYVLAFDYEVVVDAIGNKLGVDGRTYLEKVVQLQIDVPLPGRMTLERMVIGQLEAIDPTAKTLDPDAQSQFRMMFEGGIKHFLATPRACTRLLNVLRFTYPTLKGQVYFPDMLGISCLMSFCSQAIQAIRSSTEAFVGHCDASGKGWVRYREFHQTWLSELPAKDRAPVERIVRSLFPKVAWALNGPKRGEEYLGIWHEQRRICSVKHFDSYFRLGLSAGEAAEHQWQNMIELLDDATSFARAMSRFGPIEEGEAIGWVDELLQQAANFVNQQATPDQAASLFKAIFSRGGQVASIEVEQSASGLRIDPIHWVVSVLLDCLLRMESVEDRLDLIVGAITTDADLLTAVELLDLLNYRTDVFSDDPEEPSADANNQNLMKVLKTLDGRLQQASEDGKLGDHPQYMRILQRWRQFGRKTTAKKWLREHCVSDEAFVGAVVQLRNRPPTVEDNDASTVLQMPMLTKLFEPAELLDRSKKIVSEAPPWLAEPDHVTLKLLASHLQSAVKKPHAKS